MSGVQDVFDAAAAGVVAVVRAGWRWMGARGLGVQQRAAEDDDVGAAGKPDPPNQG